MKELEEGMMDDWTMRNNLLKTKRPGIIFPGHSILTRCVELATEMSPFTAPPAFPAWGRLARAGA